VSISSLLIGLGIGVCAFALTWATARHFTGLAAENSLALVIGVVVGLVLGFGYVIVESRLFDSWRHRLPH
jgi:hypothetical protein